MEAMDMALALPEMVEHILPFLDKENFLQCRLLNKFWEAEVLRAFPRREGLSHRRRNSDSLYLHVGTYIEQTLEGGPLLSQGSRLATSVYAGNEEEDATKDPKDFLLFFRSGEGKETEVLFFDWWVQGENQGQGLTSLTWGGALHQVLKYNWIPKLRKLVLHFNLDGRVNHAFENGDTDLSAGLCGLRVLVLQLWCPEEITEAPYNHLVAAILRGARNLEKLFILGTLFPQTADIANLKSLKALQLDDQDANAPSSLIPELERVLTDVSKNCPFLETLSLPFKMEEGFGGVLNLPRFPRLKVFTVRDLRCLPLDGDLPRFLRDKMPLLRSFIADSDFWSPSAAGVFWSALQSSQGSHRGLKYLSIQAPMDPRVLEGLQAKLPSLRRLDLSRPVDTLSDLALALALATNESLYSTISTVLAEGEEAEGVKAKFLLAVGPEWRGTFRHHISSHLGKNQIRLVPENL